MAEKVYSAIRLFYRAQDLTKCIRESCFSEMYGYIGDRVSQEMVRKTTPDKHHCKFLKEDPSACICLPRDIGTAKEGSPCPNNPFEDLECQQTIADAGALSPWVETAFDLLEAADNGLLPQLDQMSPEEFVTLNTTRAALKELQQEAYEDARAEREQNRG